VGEIRNKLVNLQPKKVSLEQGVALKQRANLKEEKKQRIWMAM
jgi:hypothetical protein